MLSSNRTLTQQRESRVTIPEVKYVGHIIGKNGLKVDHDKVRAIVNMPVPSEAQGVRRLLGLVQYVSKFFYLI